MIPVDHIRLVIYTVQLLYTCNCICHLYVGILLLLLLLDSPRRRVLGSLVVCHYYCYYYYYYYYLFYLFISSTQDCVNPLFCYTPLDVLSDDYINNNNDQITANIDQESEVFLPPITPPPATPPPVSPTDRPVRLTRKRTKVFNSGCGS